MIVAERTDTQVTRWTGKVSALRIAQILANAIRDELGAPAGATLQMPSLVLFGDDYPFVLEHDRGARAPDTADHTATV